MKFYNFDAALPPIRAAACLDPGTRCNVLRLGAADVMRQFGWNYHGDFA